MIFFGAAASPPMAGAAASPPAVGRIGALLTPAQADMFGVRPAAQHPAEHGSPMADT